MEYSFNYDVGENITVTDEFSMWLEEIQSENTKYKEIIGMIKESIDFSKNCNVDAKDVLENIEKIVYEISDNR